MSPPSQPRIQHAYTFPPFPSVPEGVKIIPFADFKENGIRLRSIDGKEVDGLGIATIELSKKHDTDECESDARPKKTRIAVQPDVDTVPKVWYEAWEETEDSRRVYYGHMESRISRILSATKDFHKGRPWPNGTGVRAQFEQIQLFIGTSTTNTPIWRKLPVHAEDDEDFSDDDLPPNTSPANNGKKPTRVEEIESPAESSEENDKLIEFLDDPARNVQIYLSSYMKRRGLHLSLQNVTTIPRLWRFYINFLLQNHVLPEPKLEASLRRALEYVELAAKELPKTLEIGEFIPDGLCKAFYECFEIARQDRNLQNGDGTAGEIDMTGNKTNFDNALDSSVETVFDEVLKAGNIQLVDSDLGLGFIHPPSNGATISKVVETGSINSDQPSTEGTDTQNGSDSWDNWGTGDTGSWGDAWGSTDEAAIEEVQDRSQWGTGGYQTNTPDTLLKYLGPTLFPVTHTSGVMEWSARRITSVIPSPSNMGRCSPVLAEAEESDREAVAVEQELERRFTKVVLSPWIGWAGPDDGEPGQDLPCIPRLSKGKVVVKKGNVNFKGTNAEDAVSVERLKIDAEGLKPHDPLKDDITVLLEPESEEKLKVGMGISGLWVQIARRSDLERQAKSAVGKKGCSRERFWFIGKLGGVLPSYHII